jgi:peptidoglycan/xylan/chitin deacetylase (PgdA/CDA1 family)
MPSRAAVAEVASRAARTRAARGLAELIDRLDRRSAPRLAVLTYHRVGHASERPELDPTLISAAPAEFDAQIAYLTARRRVLSLDELLEVRAGRRALPARSVMLTFDDAYEDFAEHAWPVLRRHGAPVTMFVPTGYPGEPERVFWWDRLHAAIRATRQHEAHTPIGRLTLGTGAERARAHRELCAAVRRSPRHEDALALVAAVEGALGAHSARSSVLDWDRLRKLAAEGVTLAPHTRTHPRLDRLAVTAAMSEITGSLADLEREIGPTPRVLAFPEGAYDDALVAALQRERFAIAFTTQRRVNDLRRPDWLRVGRINVGRRSSVAAIGMQLHGLTALARGAA